MKVAAHINKSAYLFPPQIVEATIENIARENPSLSFVLIFDDKKNIPADLPANVDAIALGPLIRNSFWLLFWYRLRLPGLLKKIKADVFVSNLPIRSAAQIPQLMTISDTNCLQSPFRRFFINQLNKQPLSASAAILSGRNTIELINPDRAIFLFPPVKEGVNKPDPSQRTRIINKISEGIEYFVFIGIDRRDPDFLIVLKAFSLFKKWQRSEMRLLLLTHTGETPEISDFANYKFRNDVIVPTDPSSNYSSEAISGAYAGISMRYCGATDPAMELMSCGVPVIVPDSNINRACFGEACLYAKDNEADISQKMILLYKDEERRNELIRKGFDRLSQISPRKNAEALLAAISADN